MKKLPKTINIMGTPIKVIPVKQAYNERWRRAQYGHFDSDRMEIEIYTKQPVEEQWATLFHEILHAIAYKYQIPMLKEDDNHTQLDLIAGALNDTLQRNKLLK